MQETLSTEVFISPSTESPSQAVLEVATSLLPRGIDAIVSPIGSMEILSKYEQLKLLNKNKGGLHDQFRMCCLAVLNCGGTEENTTSLLARYPDFEVNIIQRERGIKLEILSAPPQAFVDGQLIHGIQEHLFAVLRDILFIRLQLDNRYKFNLETADGTTDAVFHILRNAGALQPGVDPNLVVCWGGHSISPAEYVYTKQVGYELGIRLLDICTGCGPGAMRGPMKGATLGHSKQRGRSDGGGGRYYGFTEPGIIAAESPNPIVNRLVILPDIEKRLEAFVRAGHGIVVFPGGAGTAEEILYILGILLHPDNLGTPFPLIFTGPAASAEYFERIDHFVGASLGQAARSRYQIIIDNPERVAQVMQAGIKTVRAFRKSSGDSYYFNWGLKIDRDLQKPFEPTHEAMRGLQLMRAQAPHDLAAQLRRAFSGIVAGNVKADGIAAIKKHGPFEIQGEALLMSHLDDLLTSFVKQNRMKLPGSRYEPCYRVIV